jgi:hypothetical protein
MIVAAITIPYILVKENQAKNIVLIFFITTAVILVVGYTFGLFDQTYLAAPPHDIEEIISLTVLL